MGGALEWNACAHLRPATGYKTGCGWCGAEREWDSKTLCKEHESSEYVYYKWNQNVVVEKGGGGVGKTVTSPASGRVHGSNPTPQTRSATPEPHPFFPFFLSFFLSFVVPTSVYLLTVGVLGYCCTWSHTQTHSVGLLWTSDQPDAETSTWQHTTLTTDKHPCGWRDSNP